MEIKAGGMVKNLDGVVMKEGEKELTVFAMIANVLATCDDKTDPLKAWELARKFYKNEDLDLTAEDIAYTKEKVKVASSYVFVRGQMLEALSV